MTSSNQNQIIAMFDNIAPSYDKANRILSFGIDTLWRIAGIKGVLGRCEKAKLDIVDVACGTGDMIALWLRLCKDFKKEISSIKGVDASEKMLELAKQKFTKNVKINEKNSQQNEQNFEQDLQKLDENSNTNLNKNLGENSSENLSVLNENSHNGSENSVDFKENSQNSHILAKNSPHSLPQNLEFQNLEFIQAFAQKMPLNSDSADILSISYGFRNVVERQQALQEFARVLRTDGLLLILEFTKRSSGRGLRQVIFALRDFYLTKILPKIGKIISKNAAAYAYLPESIEGFLSAGELAKELENAGFELLFCKDFSLGISSAFIARKK